MNDVMSRLLILRMIVAMGEKNLPWCGSIAMQKLVYLLEHVFGANIGYAYGLHQLGPYSHELASDLSLGEQCHLWRGDTVHAIAGAGSYSGKRYQVDDAGDELARATPTADAEWTRIRPSVELLFGSVGGSTGRDLELIATIHYLREVQGVPEEELWEVLHALKPKYSHGEFGAGNRKLAEMEQGVRVAA